MRQAKEEREEDPTMSSTTAVASLEDARLFTMSRPSPRDAQGRALIGTKNDDAAKSGLRRS